jgi:hypothetical protein
MYVYVCVCVYVYISSGRAKRQKQGPRQEQNLPDQRNSPQGHRKSSSSICFYYYSITFFLSFRCLSPFLSFTPPTNVFSKLSIGVSFQNSSQKSQRAYGKTMRPVLSATFEPAQSFQALSSQPAAASQNANKRKLAESAEKSGRKSG